MTTTVKTTLRAKHKFGTTLFLDILVDGAVVGEAMLTRYHDEDCNYHDEDCEIKYSRLDFIDIDEAHRGKGYGSAAIGAMRKTFGRIVAAPDSEDSQRLYESIGEPMFDFDGDMEECYLDIGFGVYDFC